MNRVPSLRSMPGSGECRRGNRKGTNPGPPDRTGRTRRIAIVLRTPPRVLSSTAANCGPPFGTQRPQVQILSPRPAAQFSDAETPRFGGLCSTPGHPSRRPKEKGHGGTPGKAMAGFDMEKDTTPRSTAHQTPRHSRNPRSTAHQTPRHSRNPHGTLILRPQRRGPLVGTTAGQRDAAVSLQPGTTRQALGCRTRGRSASVPTPDRRGDRASQPKSQPVSLLRESVVPHGGGSRR